MMILLLIHSKDKKLNLNNIPKNKINKHQISQKINNFKSLKLKTRNSNEGFIQNQMRW